MMVQLVPSHSSASVALSLSPTAMQLVVDGAHDTPQRVLDAAPVGFGGACTVHALPFQCSASVVVAVELEDCPTAVHDVSETHATPRRMVDVAPLGLGVTCMVQVLPFQMSARALAVPALV